MISFLVDFDVGLEDQGLFLTQTTHNRPFAHLSRIRFIFSTYSHSSFYYVSNKTISYLAQESSSFSKPRCKASFNPVLKQHRLQGRIKIKSVSMSGNLNDSNSAAKIIGCYRSTSGCKSRNCVTKFPKGNTIKAKN